MKETVIFLQHLNAVSPVDDLPGQLIGAGGRHVLRRAEQGPILAHDVPLLVSELNQLFSLKFWHSVTRANTFERY
jgi:hypothetical protein